MRALKSPPLMLLKLIFIVSWSLALSACDKTTAKSHPHISLNAELQSAYDRSCKSCHEVAATQAPLTGDTRAWEDILEKGIEATLERAIHGYKGMPPGGQCFECSPNQLQTLIRFMSQPITAAP